MNKAFVLTATIVLAFIAGCAGKSYPVPPPAPAASLPSGPVTFANNIEPIITARCAKCHVRHKRGKLSLATLDSTLAGGKHGPDIVPGQANSSLFYKMVAGKASKRMPPKGKPLTGIQIGIIQKWINEGAK